MIIGPCTKDAPSVTGESASAKRWPSQCEIRLVGALHRQRTGHSGSPVDEAFQAKEGWAPGGVLLLRD